MHTTMPHAASVEKKSRPGLPACLLFSRASTEGGKDGARIQIQFSTEREEQHGTAKNNVEARRMSEWPQRRCRRPRPPAPVFNYANAPRGIPRMAAECSSRTRRLTPSISASGQGVGRAGRQAALTVMLASLPHSVFHLVAGALWWEWWH